MKAVEIGSDQSLGDGRGRPRRDAGGREQRSDKCRKLIGRNGTRVVRFHNNSTSKN